ncbi:hypothetical protein J1N35_006423 [Gossypium stocksii]|uniref:Uncharacterized protein n=1 Tax=Gossypium stocksii TaxID=47602 RepID=A0A9D3WH74_9ROSI|nr:hypothetical protein J1N35_006423 [Gossypium stocksii]
MGKGDISGKEMAKLTMGFEHMTTILKFKRCKVSAVRDFLLGCERGATMDHGLNRQIAVDQGKCSLSFNLGLMGHMNVIGLDGPYECDLGLMGHKNEAVQWMEGLGGGHLARNF